MNLLACIACTAFVVCSGFAGALAADQQGNLQVPPGWESFAAEACLQGVL